MAIDVLDGINEKYATKLFLSASQYKNAVAYANSIAAKSTDERDFSRKIVNTALRSEYKARQLVLEKVVLPSLKTKFPKASEQMLRAMLKQDRIKHDNPKVQQIFDDARSLLDSKSKQVMAIASKDRQLALDYCFLKCMSVVTAGYKYYMSKNSALGVHDKGKEGKHDANYEEYVSTAYFKFMYMMQGSKDKDGTLKLDAVDAAIAKNDASAKEKGTTNSYDYFDALRGRFKDELNNHNRELEYEAGNDGIVRPAKTFRYKDDRTGKQVTSVYHADTVSFDSSGNTDDEGYTMADKLTSDYMNSQGIQNDIEISADMERFLDKWKDCCADVHYVNAGKGNRWSTIKKSPDGKEKPNRKAKIFKFLILNALGQQGTATANDIYKEFYKDENSPKQKWDLDIVGTVKGGNKELSVTGILDEYDISLAEVINACTKLTPAYVLGFLKGMGSALPDSTLKTKATAAAKDIGDGRDLLNERKIQLTGDGNKYYQAFNEALSTLGNADWSDMDSNKVRIILESTLPDGIAAHKNTWKVFAMTFDNPSKPMSKKQRKLIVETIMNS